MKFDVSGPSLTQSPSTVSQTLHDIFKQQAVSSANRITLTIPAKDFARAEEAANDDQSAPSGCRLTVTVFCPHGVKKTYRLIYQAGDSMVAIASKDNCPNSFTASPRVIKDWTEYFMLGRHGTDEITFWCTPNACKIRSFEGSNDAPEGAGRSKDSAALSKQSISTTLRVETGEFDSYNLESDEALITVTLKEIKAIIDYAINIGNSIEFYFSTGGQWVLRFCISSYSSLTRYIRPLLTEFESDNLSVSFVMSTNGDDPAGVRREKQDVKPRMTQTRLGNGTANGAGASKSGPAAVPSQRQLSAMSSQRPQTSTPSVPPASSNRQPLFRPRDTESPEASASRPIKLDIDDDDDSLWAEVDAADPSFTQEAMRLNGDEQLAVNRSEDKRSAEISLDTTYATLEEGQSSRSEVRDKPEQDGGGDRRGPDVIDMSLDDDTEESVLLSGRSKRPRKVGCNYFDPSFGLY